MFVLILSRSGSNLYFTITLSCLGKTAIEMSQFEIMSWGNRRSGGGPPTLSITPDN